MVEIFHHDFERLGAGAADALEGHEEGEAKHSPVVAPAVFELAPAR